MLPYVSDEAACGSVSFPHLWGKAGMGDSRHNHNHNHNHKHNHNHPNTLYITVVASSTPSVDSAYSGIDPAICQSIDK